MSLPHCRYVAVQKYRWWNCRQTPFAKWTLIYGSHQQNVNRSGNKTQSSHTLRATSPVLLSTSRCSQTPLELSKVLSDSARAFSGCYEIWLIGYSNIGAPETSAQIGGRLREKLRLLCSSGLGETSRAAETTAQHSGRLGAIISTWWFIHYHKAFRLS